MSLLRRCLDEVVGLFVDDGPVAALTIAWIAAGCLLLRHWPGQIWTGPALFAGLAAIFLLGLVYRRG